LWEAINKWWGQIYDDIKEFAGKAIDWLKENWPKILAVLTGPFGLFTLWIVTYKDEIVEKFKQLWETVKTAVVEKVASIIGTVQALWNLLKDFIVDYFSDKAESFLGAIKAGWNLVKDAIGAIVDIIQYTVVTKFLEIFNKVAEVVSAIKTGVVDKFNELKDGAIKKFNELKDAASKVWDNISGYIRGVATNIKDKLGEVYGFMVEVGKDIARGIASGLGQMGNFTRTFLTEWVNSNILRHVKTLLGIKSPSRVMMGIGKNLTEGLYIGMGLTGKPGITLPSLNVTGGAASGVNVTINAGLGTDPIALGREVQKAIQTYGKYNTI
jgi:phage-related protein